MGVRTWLESWPVYRQLTGTDPLGRGAAAQSPRSRGARRRAPATADRVAHSRLPVLRGRLRPAGVRQGRARSSRSRATRTRPISRGRLCPKGSASKQLVTSPQRRDEGPLPRAVRHRVGATSTSTRRWT